MSESAQFDLLAAKLEAMTSEIIAQLNRDIFSAEAMASSQVYAPYPRWKRIRDQVRGYLTTLWLAICGHDFDADREDW